MFVLRSDVTCIPTKSQAIVDLQLMTVMSLSKLCCDLVALQILKKYKGLSIRL